MNLLNKCILVLLFAVFPVAVGGIYSPVFIAEKNMTFADWCKLLIQTWLYGIITMFAVMQLIAIPMISQRTSFSSLVNVWSGAVAVLAAAGLAVYIIFIVKFIKRRQIARSAFADAVISTSDSAAAASGISKSGKSEATGKSGDSRSDSAGRVSADIRRRVWIGILGAVFLAMTAFQARVASKYQHTDDDDARFVALELIAVENDQMLTHNPIDGYPMYWNTGEVKKDYTSPWTMYVAACSRISGIHPAILSHRMLPMFLIPICYMAYMIMALGLFKDDWEKTFIFMIIISAANMFGYTSTHTTASLLLLRIWQGKAVFAGLMVPVILNLCYRLYDRPDRVAEKILLFVSCMASSLLSGGGVVMSAIAVGLYGLIVFIRHKSVRNTVLIWLTCSPCIVYALCNVFWYQVFRVS